MSFDVDPGDFTPAALAKLAPACGDCGKADHVTLATGQAIYPKRPDLWVHEDGARRYWWLCSTCRAYCGIHRGTFKSLGTPAGPETRRARERAHAAFDPLWKRRAKLSGWKPQKARNAGYEWLARHLGMSRTDCHIGAMTIEQCQRVVVICTAHGK